VARVYVSSTLADLRDERQAVFDWLRLARHQAVDSYLPDSETVRDSCLADVAATLGLALSSLEDQPSATGLLRVLAFLAPEPVPLGLLLATTDAAGQLSPLTAAAVGPLLGDPLAAGDAVAALRRYSLVSSAGQGRVLVHRLVQAITRARLPARETAEWEQAGAALVAAAVPADAELPAAWPACAALLPHARAVLDLTSRGLWLMGEYLGRSGDYPAARDLLQLMADAYHQSSSFGPSDPDTLNVRNWLAAWTLRGGDASEARRQLVALVPACERALGAEHPVTLTARKELAAAAGAMGDAAGARAQLAALVVVHERVQGAESPGVLNSRNELARMTGMAGDAAGARDQFAALVPVYERVLGAEDPGTQTARAHLSYWLDQASAGSR